jgi:hypothetical protein
MSEGLSLQLSRLSGPTPEFAFACLVIPLTDNNGLLETPLLSTTVILRQWPIELLAKTVIRGLSSEVQDTLGLQAIVMMQKEGIMQTHISREAVGRVFLKVEVSCK